MLGICCHVLKGFELLIRILQKNRDGKYKRTLRTSRTKKVGITLNHLFWCGGEWKADGTLKAVDLLTLADGSQVKVTEITYEDRHTTVYNMEVADYHTYYVGEDGVWVHNTGRTCGITSGTRRGTGVGEGKKDLPWSSGVVSDASRQLDNGAKSVTVNNCSQAEELFLGKFQGEGYTNVTGMDAVDVKNYFGSKGNTYHWDDVFGSDGYLLNHASSNQDATIPHLQIHPQKGGVIRIFFENSGGN